MIIKSFRAETSAAALKAVRSEMGGDAIVLKTSELTQDRNGYKIEITACLEKPTVGQSNRIFPDAPPAAAVIEPAPVIKNDDVIINRLSNLEGQISNLLDKDNFGAKSESDTSLIYSDVINKLKDSDIPQNIIDEIIEHLIINAVEQNKAPDVVRVKLVEMLSNLMLPSIEFTEGSKIVFVGPAGSGKSSAMGKLAVQLIINEKKKVHLASLDDMKMGAHDEIHGYADLLDVEVADLNSDIDKTISDNSIILIDSPAMPSDEINLNKLTQKIEALNADFCFAVFSSLTRSSDIAQMMKQVKKFNPTHLIITMQDLTDRLGSIMAAANSSDLKVIYVSDAPGGIGSINAPDPDLISRKIMKAEVALEKA